MHSYSSVLPITLPLPPAAKRSKQRDLKAKYMLWVGTEGRPALICLAEPTLIHIHVQRGDSTAAVGELECFRTLRSTDHSYGHSAYPFALP